MGRHFMNVDIFVMLEHYLYRNCCTRMIYDVTYMDKMDTTNASDRNNNVSPWEHPVGPNITLADIYFHWSFYKVTVPILFTFIIAVGFVGNLLVVFVILSKKKMRNTVNLLLLNLAVSDILFLTLSVPFVTYHYAADNWNIAEFFCKLWQFVLYVTVYITVYTLVAISGVRYFTMVISPKTVYFRKTKNALLLVMLLWLLMLTVNIPILYSYNVKEFPPGYRYCAVNNGRQVHLTFFTFSYIIPFILIATFYTLLMRFLTGNRKRSSLRHSNRSASSEERGRDRTAFASRIVLVVVAVFGISWLPLHLSLLWAHYGTQPETRAYQVFRVMCHCLAYANSCMNPIIYNYVSKDFRKRFRGIWISCGEICSTPNVNGSQVLNTYDYKNENATCNGGASSVCRGDKHAESKNPEEDSECPSSEGQLPSDFAEHEKLCMTEQRSGDILVTDL